MIKNNKFLNLITILITTTFLLSGCAHKNIEHTKNYKQDQPQQKTSSQKFSERLNLDDNTFKNLTSTKYNNQEYTLIPINKSQNHLTYWNNLLTSDEDYMQTFFLERKSPSTQRATSIFKNEIVNMWIKPKPTSINFILSYNGNFSGIIETANLSTENDSLIGYAVSKEYKGNNIASISLKMLLNLIKHLNSTGFYNIKSTSVWIFNDNTASQKVAQKNGFVYAESDDKNKRCRYSFQF